jgi:hypothetical protein
MPSGRKGAIDCDPCEFDEAASGEPGDSIKAFRDDRNARAPDAENDRDPAHRRPRD